jgi:hypothetical protein
VCAQNAHVAKRYYKSNDTRLPDYWVLVGTAAFSVTYVSIANNAVATEVWPYRDHEEERKNPTMGRNLACKNGASKKSLIMLI